MLRKDAERLATTQAERTLEAQINAARTAAGAALTVPGGGTLGQVLTKGASGYSWQDAAGSAAVTAGALVVTVPGPAGRFEHDETLAAVGVTASMKVLLALAPHSDADENNEQALDLRGMAGEAGTDTITVRLAFGALTSGPIRINYMAV
jgi:hypothetical protein